MSAATITPQTTNRPRVTAKPIAEHYNVTEPTVYKWAKDGKIPCFRFEGTVRFDFEAVVAKIEGRASK
ncbi:MAG: DNA-binding protein [Verrucomicrobiaceae bacterium]|nr:MAG: DNA-binding protein [Verrucomicrobiaceae bacterium]